MIIPAVVNLAAYRNGYSTFSFSLTVKGQPIDFTGSTALFQVRLFPGAPDAALLAVTSAAANGNGSTIAWDDITTGKITVTVKEPDYADFPQSPRGVPQSLSYDLLIIDGAGDPAPYVQGLFVFRDGVSRDGG